MSTTEQTTQAPAEETQKTACTGKDGARIGLVAVIDRLAAAGLFGGPAGVAPQCESKKAKSVSVTLHEAQAYLQANDYKPKVLDVVRLNANGRVISEIPGDPETAVVVRVFDKPVFSGDACLHGRYGRAVVDCTLLMCTEVGGEKFYSEMLFNSVFLELAPAA